LKSSILDGNKNIPDLSNPISTTITPLAKMLPISSSTNLIDVIYKIPTLNRPSIFLVSKEVQNTNLGTIEEEEKDVSQATISTAVLSKKRARHAKQRKANEKTAKKAKKLN
jgi:hypothetical protein